MTTKQLDARIPYDACPLCGAKEISTILKADCSKHHLYKPAIPPIMTWCACAACGHVFTDGYFSDAALQIIFSDTHENQKVGFEIEKQRYISARMVEKILPYAQTGYWLDVGFGNGSLLFTAQEYGFTPVGADLRKENVDIMNKIGIEAHCADLKALQQQPRFDVISMADVLEHMPFPVEGLGAAHRLLNPGGILFVSMPNMDSVLWNVLSSNNANPYWGELEHYHNFGRKRLFRLLQDNGFEPLRFGISERYRACMEVISRKIEQ
jgi:protein O-GlcNAc transferase